MHPDRTHRAPHSPAARPSLRHATAAAHHALDHHHLLQRLLASDLTREQYADSLAAMYAPHATLEHLVHASRHHAESGLELSARVDRLQADLRDLGRAVPGLPASPVPNEARATWWGRVYVLEGSRRGASFIARRVKASLGDSVPCRFFGEAALPDNRDAVQAMRERELEAPGELDLAVASALEAFASYQGELEANDRERTSTTQGN